LAFKLEGLANHEPTCPIVLSCLVRGESISRSQLQQTSHPVHPLSNARHKLTPIHITSLYISPHVCKYSNKPPTTTTIATTTTTQNHGNPSTSTSTSTPSPNPKTILGHPPCPQKSKETSAPRRRQMAGYAGGQEGNGEASPAAGRAEGEC